MGKTRSNYAILEFVVTLNSGDLLPFHMVVAEGTETRVIKEVTGFVLHVKERGVSVLMEVDDIKVVKGKTRSNSTNVVINGKDVSSVSGSLIADVSTLESKVC